MIKKSIDMYLQLLNSKTDRYQAEKIQFMANARHKYFKSLFKNVKYNKKSVSKYN